MATPTYPSRLDPIQREKEMNGRKTRAREPSLLTSLTSARDLLLEHSVKTETESIQKNHATSTDCDQTSTQTLSWESRSSRSRFWHYFK
jgi:hypothetical protein